MKCDDNSRPMYNTLEMNRFRCAPIPQCQEDADQIESKKARVDTCNIFAVQKVSNVDGRYDLLQKEITDCSANIEGIGSNGEWGRCKIKWEPRNWGNTMVRIN